VERGIAGVGEQEEQERAGARQSGRSKREWERERAEGARESGSEQKQTGAWAPHTHTFMYTCRSDHGCAKQEHAYVYIYIYIYIYIYFFYYISIYIYI